LVTAYTILEFFVKWFLFLKTDKKYKLVKPFSVLIFVRIVLPIYSLYDLLIFDLKSISNEQYFSLSKFHLIIIGD